MRILFLRPTTIYVTARRIIFRGSGSEVPIGIQGIPAFHTALEYRDPVHNIPVWYSGLPDDDVLKGRRIADEDNPRNMILFGYVYPSENPVETMVIELDQAYQDYCNNLDYNPIPESGEPDEYNSNGYANGTILHIGGTFVPRPEAALNLNYLVPGWSKPIPSSAFGC